MHFRAGDHWFCTNPGCAASLHVETGSAIPMEGKNPRCSCSAVMKKQYSPPALTYLDFLYFDGVPAELRKVREG